MDILKSNIVVGLTAGIAATLLAPLVIPAVAMAARPLTKSLLKGGVMLYEKGREALASAGEEMEDLIAEVRSELETEHENVYAASTGAAPAAEDAEISQQQESSAGKRPDGGGATHHAGNGAHA